jgi:hypothetical protein
VRGRGEHARRGLVVEVCGRLVAEGEDGERARVDAAVGGLRDVVELAGADEGVDFRNLRAQLVAVALDEAAGDDQPTATAVRLHPRRFEDGLDRLLLRRVDKPARVDDDGVGLGRVARQLVTFGFEPPHHHLAVHEVFRTAQTDESDFLHEYNQTFYDY